MKLKNKDKVERYEYVLRSILNSVEFGLDEPELRARARRIGIESEYYPFLYGLLRGVLMNVKNEINIVSDEFRKENV